MLWLPEPSEEEKYETEHPGYETLGSESSLGWGTIDDKLLSLEIKFNNGELTNRFTFDPRTNSWTSLIRQVEHGEWKTFCEDKFVRTDAKK
jgi:hypothetical protein